MRMFPRRIARTLGLSAEEERAAATVLGHGHPLARTLGIQRTLARQALATLGAVLVSLSFLELGLRDAALLLGASILVELGLVVALTTTRRVARWHARDLIADGDDVHVLPIVASERRRLNSREVRDGLARSLEELLRDAQRWHELHPLSRPLPGVRFLIEAAHEATEVAAHLRAEHVRAQGVALMSKLLTDGSESPLYAGDPGRLREELARIRYLLDASGTPTFGVEREAA